MASLYRLTASIKTLSYIKPKTLEGFLNAGVETVSDLLLYRPRLYDDRSKLHRAYEVHSKGQINTFAEVVNMSYFGPPDKPILKISMKECNIQPYEQNSFIENTINLLCFNRNFMSRYVRIGAKYYLTAKVERKYATLVDAAQFELHSALEAENFGFGEILPVYPLNVMLTQNAVRSSIRKTLELYSAEIENDLPSELYKKYGLFDIKTAINELHAPHKTENIEKSRRTLAFNEIYFLLLEKGLFGGREGVDKVELVEPSEKENAFIDSLPFTLTSSQNAAVSDILSDLDAPFSMKRLLQGDVGSGKTIVALISAYHEVLKGNQVIFMVPTELLALQHYESALRLFEHTDVKVGLLKGSLSSKKHKEVLDKIENNEYNIILGTHSLLSEGVKFASSLSYAIIDEEHRFGVVQRESFYKNNPKINVLSMSATPIPRSLSEAMCGRLNISTLNELPEGRLPIITHLVSESKRREMYKAIALEFERGHQAYFVSPRIDSNRGALRDVYDLEMELTKTYEGLPYGVIHSKVSEEDKVKILNDFNEGKLKYIIATSVVEVGIDNPNATCMVIEHADLFGLATLHQLRGRVGRSSLQSWCFLVYSPNLTPQAAERLKAMRDTADGFVLSERDAALRGTGDLLGTKQSGESTLLFASIENDKDLLEAARREIIGSSKR